MLYNLIRLGLSSGHVEPVVKIIQPITKKLNKNVVLTVSLQVIYLAQDVWFRTRVKRLRSFCYSNASGLMIKMIVVQEPI